MEKKIPVEVVGLYRAHSGGYLVNSGLNPKAENPFEKMAKELAMTARANYGEIQLVVTSSFVPGYNGYPGCTIVLLPGNKNGIIENTENVRVREPLPKKLKGPVSARDFPGNLTLEFNFDDLEKLHAALGKVIKYNKDSQEVG